MIRMKITSQNTQTVDSTTDDLLQYTAVKVIRHETMNLIFSFDVIETLHISIFFHEFVKLIYIIKIMKFIDLYQFSVEVSNDFRENSQEQ